MEKRRHNMAFEDLYNEPEGYPLLSLSKVSVFVKVLRVLIVIGYAIGIHAIIIGLICMKQQMSLIFNIVTYQIAPLMVVLLFFAHMFYIDRNMKRTIGSVKLTETEIIVSTKDIKKVYPFHDLKRISVRLHKGFISENPFYYRPREIPSFEDIPSLVLCIIQGGKMNYLIVKNHNFKKKNIGQLVSHLDTLKNKNLFMYRLIQFYY